MYVSDPCRIVIVTVRFISWELRFSVVDHALLLTVALVLVVPRPVTTAVMVTVVPLAAGLVPARVLLLPLAYQAAMVALVRL